MTTATLNRTVVEPKWNTTKIQEEAVRMYALQFMTAMNVLCKQGEQAAREFTTAMQQNKIEHYKQLNIKTPIELVQAMSEFETNVFGSKIEIWGDEKAAHLQYNQCGMWNAMKNTGKMNCQQEEKMGQTFEHCVQGLAQGFGFKGEVKFEGEKAVLTFTK